MALGKQKKERFEALPTQDFLLSSSSFIESQEK